MYSTAYILLFLLYALLALSYHYAQERWQRYLKIISIAVFILFFGFRGFVGDDWTIYYSNFNSLYTDNFRNILISIRASDFEPGFTFFEILCKLIVPSYHFLIFICCIINCYLLYRFLNKRVDNLPLALMCFFIMSGTGLEINLLRNSIALLICLNALDFIESKRFVPYLLLCIFASFIHISSLIFIPIYFILNRRISKRVYLVILLSSAFFLILQIKFIGPLLLSVAAAFGEIFVIMVKAYIQGEYLKVESALTIGYLERVIVGLIIYCYYDKLISLNKSNVVLINAFLIYFVSFALFREFEVACRRIVLLFVFSYWVLWCEFFKCFTLKSNKIIFALFLICYGILKINSLTNFPKMEYDNILFGAKSYELRHSTYMITKGKQ